MSAIRSLAVRLVGTAAVLTGVLNVGLTSASAENAWFSDPTPAKPVAATTSPAPAASASPATLPNGATSLSEVYGDWTVSCSMQSSAERCAAKQEQVNQQNRQIVLALELVPVGDKLEGIALLPFGLALESGVSLQIDELPDIAPIQFQTCLPTGCVVPLSFDTRVTASLRNGALLKAKVVVAGGGETVLSISLKGFAQAIDRAAVLAPSAREPAEKVSGRLPAGRNRR
jgi:invasion protein IalB